MQCPLPRLTQPPSLYSSQSSTEMREYSPALTVRRQHPRVLNVPSICWGVTPSIERYPLLYVELFRSRKRRVRVRRKFVPPVHPSSRPPVHKLTALQQIIGGQSAVDPNRSGGARSWRGGSSRSWESPTCCGTVWIRLLWVV